MVNNQKCDTFSSCVAKAFSNGTGSQFSTDYCKVYFNITLKSISHSLSKKKIKSFYFITQKPRIIELIMQILFIYLHFFLAITHTGKFKWFLIDSRLADCCHLSASTVVRSISILSFQIFKPGQREATQRALLLYSVALKCA